MSDETYPFTSPRKLFFEKGAIKQVGEEIRKLGGKRSFIICDPIVTERNLIEPVLESLEKDELEYGIWNETEPEPFSPSVQDALEGAREGNYDSIIGIGGGSTMDTAKMVSVLLKEKKDIMDYFGSSLPERKVPFILAPTTSGTGSEVSNCSIIGNPEKDFKHAFYSSHLYPDIAIVDPLLTKTAPPALTAMSGCDALSHAIEAYISLKATSITDMFAERAIDLVNENLRSAFSNGDDVDARLGMSKASLFAGLAFGNAGTVFGHALGYAHTYIHHKPHGLSVSLTQPYAMEYNIITNLEKFAKIANLLGKRTEELSVREAAFGAPKAYKELLTDLDMPSTLEEVGATREDVPRIAKNVFDSEAHVARNPREITEKGARKVVSRALTGRLKRQDGRR